MSSRITLVQPWIQCFDLSLGIHRSERFRILNSRLVDFTIVFGSRRGTRASLGFRFEACLNELFFYEGFAVDEFSFGESDDDDDDHDAKGCDVEPPERLPVDVLGHGSCYNRSNHETSKVTDLIPS